MSLATFKVSKIHIDGATEGTLTIDRDSPQQTVTFRPKGKHHSYKMRLRTVAEMIAWGATRRGTKREGNDGGS